MASNTIHCEIIAHNLSETTAIQLDEEHNVIYALTNYQLTHIDLNNSNNNVQVVYQHNRNFKEKTMNEDDDYYSQGESDDEETSRVSDPFEDSEPSTDDDEEKISNRRNWRRYGWRMYQLDNPCSILFLSEDNRLIILNEGVITFLTIQLEDNRPFVQGPSKNIFCYDFDVFNNNDDRRRGIQPWSIARTSTVGVFIFSLLQGSQLYSLDIRNENAIIQKFTTTIINNCPYLLFHPQSNIIFIYDSTQILVMSPDDGTTIKVDLPFF
jgi:hypothetical protein